MDIDRIVTLIDMDCFYCQVEEKLNSALKGKPIAVVQYNQWKGGGIIAVNYLAKARGVTRHMRGDEAREVCPDIELPQVPCNRGKADISKYREAGKEVANVLQEFTPLLERASIDEAYMDITQLVCERLQMYRDKSNIKSTSLQSTFVLGYDSVQAFMSDVFKETHNEDVLFECETSLRLLVGALVVEEIRSTVFERTGYKCSAGVANNKILAKLVCGMNKPDKQTLLPNHCVALLYESLPVSKIKSLGGKFGVEVCQKLNIVNMKDLLQFSEKELQKYFDEKNGSWLYNIARGVDNEAVTPRMCPKSIGCCKKFPGVTAIADVITLNNWLKELGSEIEERMLADMIENNRHPTQLVVQFNKQLSLGKDVSCSRSCNLKPGSKVDGELFAKLAFDIIKKDSKPFIKTSTSSDGEMLMHPIKFLGLTVGKFQDNVAVKSKISNFFVNSASNSEKLSLEKLVLNEQDAEKTSKTNSGKKDNSTSVKQKSFFANYAQNAMSTSPVPVEIDEQSDSSDSTGTIDMEINLSKQLFDPKDEPSTERPGLGGMFGRASEPCSIPDDLLPPIIKPQLRQYVFCDICNTQVFSNEYSTHLDYHLALSLSEEVETNAKLTSPKSNKINVSKNSSSDIKQFFKVPDKENLEKCETELCAECGRHIRLIEYAEHLDYHEAKKLSIELNSNKSMHLDTSGSSSSSVKRKMVSVSPKEGKKKARKEARTRSIDSFFK